MSNKLTKEEMNKRQVFKTATQDTIFDCMCDLDTQHKTKNSYNKKLIWNVINWKDKTHKEKQASYYLDMDEALLLADDIITNRFKEMSYNKKQGQYVAYGGKEISRVLQITYLDKTGSYAISIGLYKAITTDTNGTIPDKNNPIDTHKIVLSNFEMRKAMSILKAHIESKLFVLTSLPSETEKTVQEPVAKQEKSLKDLQKEVEEIEEDDDFPLDFDF